MYLTQSVPKDKTEFPPTFQFCVEVYHYQSVLFHQYFVLWHGIGRCDLYENRTFVKCVMIFSGVWSSQMTLCGGQDAKIQLLTNLLRH